MTQAEFLQYLSGQVKRYRKTYHLNEGKAFGLWYSVDSLGLQEDEAFEAVSVDGGNDKDIDFFYVDQESEKVLVGQLKYNAAGRYKAGKAELLALLHCTDWLRDAVSLDRDGRKDLAAAAREYEQAVSAGFAIEYLYVYCGPSHKDVNDTARQFNLVESTAAISRSCRIVHLTTLIAEHNERIDQSTRIAKATLAYSKASSFREDGKFGSALVTTMTGDQLRGLYLTHGDRLFDRNVRLFLGARRGGVNAGMRDTVASTQDRPNFWAYNNGVTFVCDRFTTGTGTLRLTNFSIVNGCQTTVVIANSDPEAASSIRILARFIASPEWAIDSIIRFTNSQNPIRLWDLSAQDKLQKRLKKEIAALPQPFLYVLRKGEVRQLTKTQRTAFRRDGKGPICTIPFDLNAQYLAAFRGFPATAYKDKGKVFASHYDQVFPDQVRAEEVAFVWQAGQAATATVAGLLSSAVSAGETDRVSVLKRGGKFFVLAAMSIVLHERNGATFLNRLKPEVAISNNTVKRLTNYAKIAVEWYLQSTLDLMANGNEITTIVRSQDYWGRVSEKIRSQWKVYSVSRKVMEGALPII